MNSNYPAGVRTEVYEDVVACKECGHEMQVVVTLELGRAWVSPEECALCSSNDLELS